MSEVTSELIENDFVSIILNNIQEEKSEEEEDFENLKWTFNTINKTLFTYIFFEKSDNLKVFLNKKFINSDYIEFSKPGHSDVRVDIYIKKWYNNNDFIIKKLQEDVFVKKFLTNFYNGKTDWKKTEHRNLGKCVSYTFKEPCNDYTYDVLLTLINYYLTHEKKVKETIMFENEGNFGTVYIKLNENKELEKKLVTFYEVYVELEKILLPISIIEKNNIIKCIKSTKIKDFFKRNIDLF